MPPESVNIIIIIIAAAIIIGIPLLLWASLSALKRRRLFEDLPTSKTSGVFIGLVELKGTAESEQPHRSFLAEQNCVWYSWTIQEQWRRTVAIKKGTRTESGWTTVASGSDTSLFYLQDELGVIQINPARAEIHATKIFNKTVSKRDSLYYDKGPSKGIMNSTGKRWFTEQAISLHQPIYVVGQARERTDCVAAEIAHATGAPIFMISTSTEELHRSWGLYMFWLCGITAVLLAIVGGIGLTVESLDPMTAIGIPTALGGGMLTIWGIGWLWMVYNSLIGLKNRVKMATANIDVELKRRFDLIPQLLRVIEGMQQHERQVQEMTALLRKQGTIDSVSDDVKGCSRQLIGLAENYPELKTNKLFLTLQTNLSETEQRIALARNYYNDVIETYNNRCERFPESMIALLAGMKLILPFQAEDFERNNIEVRLAE